MKSSVEVALIAGFAILAGTGTWFASGRPSGEPVTELAQTPLKEGEVRLQTLLEEGTTGVLWVDARRKDAWQKDGLEGSIHVTTLSDEDLGMQIVRHENAFFGAAKVVIYCDDLHCSLSHDLAERMKAEYSALVAGEILVLQGGMTALREAGMIKDSN
ncbi:hypothetical protein HAHE_12130 [Haloferula helveola]|uniref:Rhodanese domain-containing protein n=1 Tax=Haloferula helveola TaxID=490095 RepID=A0ABN6H157_9BACT|nr:hypothetical protein HAHE_12130 [Haloferula helveola]